MSALSEKWNKTKNIYLNWLINTDLKKIFSKNIYYRKLSLWWLTDIYEKDALKDHSWFNNLFTKINNKKTITFKKNFNFFLNF